jgi:hypothetical protein
MGTLWTGLWEALVKTLPRKRPQGPIEEELRRIVADRYALARADLIRLPRLRDLLGDLGLWTGGTGAGFGEVLKEYLTGHIDRLALAEPDKRSLRIDLALEVPRELANASETTPQERHEQAAIAAGVPLSKYVHHRGEQAAVQAANVQALATAIEAERPQAPQAAILPSARPQAPPKLGKLYHQVTPHELAEGFWWRESTERFIEQIAELPSLAIYAGADGPADIGPPLHEVVVAAALRDCLADDEFMDDVSETEFNRITEDLIASLRAYVPASYLGSIVRGLYARREGMTYREVERRLGTGVVKLSRRRSTVGFVARSITELAFSLRRAGHSVTVISTHSDSDLLRAPEPVRRHHRNLEGVSYDVHDHTDPVREGDAARVPLVRLNDESRALASQPLLVAEGDLLDQTPDGESSRSRADYLRAVLTSSPVLFVGTSLTDPVLVSLLIETKRSGLERYAVMLPPEGFRAEVRADHAARRELALRLNVLAGRYLHLGVVPVMADFRYQVPQLLHELSLAVDRARPYRPYRERIDDWWDNFGAGFVCAIPSDAPRGENADSVALQGRWAAVLEQLRDGIYKQADRADGGDEEIIIEVWLRHPRMRYLFRWASLDADAGDPLPPASLLVPGNAIQKTFREGRTFRQEIPEDRWQYSVSMPLVLHGDDWDRIPVGVIRLLTDQTDGSLRRVAEGGAMRDFERTIKDRLRQLFALEDAPDRTRV